MRHSGLKRIAAVLFLILFSLSFAAARQGIVTWMWFENDPMVGYYRYQVDGEDEDGWTVVDWSVTEAAIELDVSVVHTLYLQQSYDGVVWSPSSCTESEVYPDEEEQPHEPAEEYETLEFLTDEAAREVREEAESEAETEEPAAEEEIQEAAEPQVSKYKALSQLDLGVGYMDYLPDTAGSKTLGISASYSRTFVKFGVFDVGAKADVSLYTTRDLVFDRQQTQMYLQLNVLGLVSAAVEKCDIHLAFGPELCFVLGRDGHKMAGIAAEIGVRYHRTEKLAFGAVLSDHAYLIRPRSRCNMMDLRLYVSLAL